MKPEIFATSTEHVSWHIKINKEIDDEFIEFQKHYGKINKTKLISTLMQQYMEKYKK